MAFHRICNLQHILPSLPSPLYPLPTSSPLLSLPSPGERWCIERIENDNDNDDDCNNSFYQLQNKDAGDSDSEKEQEELNELENLLKKHDPDFSKWVRQSETC